MSEVVLLNNFFAYIKLKMGKCFFLAEFTEILHLLALSHFHGLMDEAVTYHGRKKTAAH